MLLLHSVVLSFWMMACMFLVAQSQPADPLVAVNTTEMKLANNLLSDASASSASSNAGIALTADSSCDKKKLARKLDPLFGQMHQCAKEAQYDLVAGNLNNFTQKNVELMCQSKNCTQLLVDLDAAGLPACQIKVSNEMKDLKVFFHEVTDQCNSNSSHKQQQAQNQTSMAVVSIMSPMANKSGFTVILVAVMVLIVEGL